MSVEPLEHLLGFFINIPKAMFWTLMIVSIIVVIVFLYFIFKNSGEGGAY